MCGMATRKSFIAAFVLLSMLGATSPAADVHANPDIPDFTEGGSIPENSTHD